MSRKITVPLTSQGIQDAISELNRYKADLERKTNLLRQKIATQIAWSASHGFSSAVADDIVNGGAKYANVEVSITDRGTTTIVIADGEDAVFIEFGAGVYYNGSVGSSPHPKGGELGFTIGGYGKGLGRKSIWGYYDGGLVLTHGTPAAMPMYRGVQDACRNITEIAREVFRT